MYNGKIPLMQVTSTRVNDYPRFQILTRCPYNQPETSTFMWIDNPVFTAELLVLDIHRQGHAANFKVEIISPQCSSELNIQLNRAKATMFMVDMLKVIQTNEIVAGVAGFSTWTFCKRGKYYGICLAGE